MCIRDRFYTAIKSTNANARVLTCIDQRWTWEDGTANQYGAKKFIDAFTVDVASHGNIDWGVDVYKRQVQRSREVK